MFFLSSNEDIMMNDLIGGLLDSIAVFPLTIVVMFAMLQDRSYNKPMAVYFSGKKMVTESFNN